MTPSNHDEMWHLNAQGVDFLLCGCYQQATRCFRTALVRCKSMLNLGEAEHTSSASVEIQYLKLHGPHAPNDTQSQSPLVIYDGAAMITKADLDSSAQSDEASEMVLCALFYNMALSVHMRALLGPKTGTKLLSKALSFYSSALAVMTVTHPIHLAIYNNIAHISSLLGMTDKLDESMMSLRDLLSRVTCDTLETQLMFMNLMVHAMVKATPAA